MPLTADITFHGLDPSPAIEARIRARVEQLDRFHPRIGRCRVVVEAPHRRHHKGKTYSVRIEAHVAGAVVAVNRDPGKDHAHEDVYVAIRDAFDALDRRLEDHARRKRGEVKTHEAPLTGRIVRLFPDRAYGFIATSDGQEVHFHAAAVVGARFADLAVDMTVRVVLGGEDSSEGPQASTVQPVPPEIAAR
ncbi:MAG: HPF/RaiA family ribosome-associated protein [Alphaproteobacteria bacterium]|nr:HPF/RaiA family ribosome-associated protein [Alphaproteobacteria bacterium]